MPRGWTGVSLPLISTWGSWPTEKFRSLILSEISNIRSIMGGNSKKLIYDRNSARVLVVGGLPLERNYASRIRVRFSRITMTNARKLCLSQRVDKVASYLGDAVRV